ncbi:hypothetical protein P2318_16675 [Myxococcaceae bacterium GXIMD 01537]
MVQAQSMVLSSAIDPARELVITDVSVVDDPLYTTWVPGASGSDPRGAWSFGRLMETLAPEHPGSPRARSQFVLSWLRSWERDKVVNTHTVPARPAIRTRIIDPWRAASGCTGPDSDCVLDMAQAPFRLLGIVYRPDLRRVDCEPSRALAGQGRLVFGALGPGGTRQPFTVIFEYQLPAIGGRDTLAWARRWHALGQVPFGPDYNARLHDVTRRFTRRGAVSWARNGSALLQLRTNEIPLSPVEPKLWEMREFILGSKGGLVLVSPENEPDASFNGSVELGNWVRRNALSVLAGRHQLPKQYKGAYLRAGAAPVPSQGGAWQVPGVPEDVRGAFALATCSGCHKAETGTNFLHLRSREVGAASQLSAFLQGQLAPGGPRLLDYLSLLNAQNPEAVRDGIGLDRGHGPEDAVPGEVVE